MKEANYGKCRDLSVIWEFSNYLCGDQDHTPQRTPRAQSVQDICQRYYVFDY